MSKLSRRKILGYGAVFGIIAAGGTFVIPKLAPAHPVLRPPGALKEKKFLATCIKCGQCLQVCPYHSVKLMDINHGLSMGAPVITPEKRGCYLCDLLPCVLSCPSGALDHKISDGRDVMMGKAEISAPDRCLAVIGTPVNAADVDAVLAGKPMITEVEIKLAEKLKGCAGGQCRICVDFCPYPDRDLAIGITEYGAGLVPEIKEKCVGCGVCEELCPTKVITTVPLR